MQHLKLDFATSSAQQVYEWLRAEILRGALGPGVRLSEAEISKQAGVSRQPVREAFIRLTANGLAETRPQRGTYISRISVSAVLSARLIREAVESDLVRMIAASKVEDSFCDRLDAEIEKQRVAISDEDVERFVELDDDFHRIIAEAAEQEAVWNVLEGLKSQMNRLRYITARRFGTENLLEQHAAIVTGLRAGSPDQAEQAMRTHLRELLHDLPEVSRDHADIFTV